MRIYFWLGVIVIYIGFAVLVWEVCLEPELLKRSYWIQVVLIGVILVPIDWFTIGVVAARAPIVPHSYVRPSDDHPPGTEVGGITWDSHFTDLRVSFGNPTDDDYQDVDVLLTPDKWIYRAAILNPTSGCELSVVGGNTISVAKIVSNTTRNSEKFTVSATPTGTGVDFYDNAGNLYTVLATEPGYRLRCSKLPSRYAIDMIFAVVTLPSADLVVRPAKPPAGGRSLAVSELSGAGSMFDTLGPPPSPREIALHGKYMRGLKPFSIATTLRVPN